MMHFIEPSAQPRHSFMSDLLARYSELRPRISVSNYQRLHSLRSPAPATWIFAGYDYAVGTPDEALAKRVEAELAAGGRRMLNRPSRVALRVDLLRRLYAAGINSFRAFELDEDDIEDLRFPVFIRSVMHDGKEEPLLRSNYDLETMKCSRRWAGGRSQRGMISEYCETKCADGLYRKYSVMRIGDAYIPRHVLFSGSWVTRTADVVTPALLAEEEAFAESTVLGDVKRAFEIAGIEYGRMDYSLAGDRPQIWEINMNPVLVPATLDPLRAELQRRAERRMVDALLQIGEPACT